MDLENTKKSCCSKFFQEQVVARGRHAVAMPSVALGEIGELIRGIFLAASSLLMLNLDGERFDSAVDQLQRGGNLLSALFKELLFTINPKAGTSYNDNIYSLSYAHSTQSCDFEKLGEDYCSVRPFDENTAKMEPTVRAHFSRRCMALFSLVKVLFFRVIDTVIALFAVPAAILTLGKIKKLNMIACSTLDFPVVLADVFFFTTKIFNPWAGKVVDALMKNPVILTQYNEEGSDVENEGSEEGSDVENEGSEEEEIVVVLNPEGHGVGGSGDTLGDEDK